MNIIAQSCRRVIIEHQKWFLVSDNGVMSQSVVTVASRLGHQTCKNVGRITYIVLAQTLNHAQSINQSVASRSTETTLSLSLCVCVCVWYRARLVTAVWCLECWLSSVCVCGTELGWSQPCDVWSVGCCLCMCVVQSSAGHSRVMSGVLVVSYLSSTLATLSFRSDTGLLSTVVHWWCDDLESSMINVCLSVCHTPVLCWNWWT